MFFKICASVKFPRKVAFYGYTTKIALVTLPRVCLIGLKSQMNYIFLPSSVTQRAFEKILFRAVSILVDVLFCFVLPLLSCLIESYLLFISTISYHWLNSSSNPFRIVVWEFFFQDKLIHGKDWKKNFFFKKWFFFGSSHISSEYCIILVMPFCAHD